MVPSAVIIVLAAATFASGFLTLAWSPRPHERVGSITYLHAHKVGHAAILTAVILPFVSVGSSERGVLASIAVSLVGSVIGYLASLALPHRVTVASYAASILGIVTLIAAALV